ncbi:protein FAM122A [Copidosoma floridanum]|uniref:protein FAM122A n=1 Tax=Copidosoma floridanum TaxID=29053 RepID=UPI0006C9BC2E|nr:protein FAM122A [Copidosoma floridanum]
MSAKSMQQASGETTMSVDCPVQASLKRSSSAPMINEISATMSISSPTTPAPPRDTVASFGVFSSLPRVRRFSTSSPGGTVGMGPRLTPRVNQLRREECIDVVAGREAAHEKEIHSTMQISQSWEDLTFDTDNMSFKDSSTESTPSNTLPATGAMSLPLKPDKQFHPKKIFDPLNLNVSTGGTSSCSSPSPTRSGFGQRQCYSPSLHAAWKNGSLSPSPTRKAFATRRSLSPISIRPSCLSGTSIAMKRKFEFDDSSAMDRLLQPPMKRTFNLLVNPFRGLETGFSPFSSIATSSTGSVGTPESLSSADSPNFSNPLVEENSPSSSSRTLLQSDDASMSDNSNDPQQLKLPIEVDTQSASNSHEESPSDASDNR